MAIVEIYRGRLLRCDIAKDFMVLFLICENETRDNNLPYSGPSLFISSSS